MRILSNIVNERTKWFIVYITLIFSLMRWSQNENIFTSNPARYFAILALCQTNQSLLNYLPIYQYIDQSVFRYLINEEIIL